MEEKNLNENKTSLLRRSIAKFHNSQIVKKIAGLTLAGAMIFSMTGCEYDISIKPNGSDTEINIEGTINPPSNDTTNSQTNPELGEYSELLLNVLNNPDYNSLLGQATVDSKIYTSAYLDPHPYAFLEDEGYDVHAIKNGLLTCVTKSFTKPNEPNNLYIATYVETKDSEPYYTEYLLKYKLTDQEMADYDMLHKHEYIQAVFMNDAISEFKTPTVISKVKCTVKAHENILDDLRDKSAINRILHDNSLFNFIMTDFNAEKETFNLLIFSGKNHRMKVETYIANLPLITVEIESINDKIYSYPYTWGEFGYPDTIGQVDGEKTIIYSPQDCALNRVSKFLLEQ